MWEPEELKIPGEHGPQNHLSSTHRGSQRLKWKSWSLHGSMLGPLLHAVAFMGLLIVEVGVSLTLLPTLNTTFLLLGCIVQP